MRKLPLLSLLLLGSCTSQAEWRNVASTIRVEAGSYNGEIDPSGPKRGFDSDGTYLGISFQPFVNLEQPRQVIVVQPPPEAPVKPK